MNIEISCPYDISIHGQDIASLPQKTLPSAVPIWNSQGPIKSL